jgi:tRNA threonylcarbamoyladenosine modification (KEOPS) complex  Pcc1 subunit
MSDDAPAWRATVTVTAPDDSFARSLERALQPEVRREVPRARAELTPVAGGRLEIAITAGDTGAMRAALNTYLGWIHLAAETVRSVDPPPSGAGDPVR